MIHLVSESLLFPLHKQLLDAPTELRMCLPGFVSITDPQLEQREVVLHKRREENTYRNMERVVYRVTWEGGGRLTARVL